MFANSRPSASNFKSFEITRTIYSNSAVKGQNNISSCRFHRSNELEQLEFKLEKIIGIEKHAGKVRKCIFQSRW